MKNIEVASIVRAKADRKPVKVYALVQSRSRDWVLHKVIYVRNARMRRWICTCENFLFRKLGLNRNCDHIKHIRAKYGRFGEKV